MAVSLEKPGFAFSEVVAILVRLFQVDEGKRDTFIARLQQLQRLGLPSGVNTGRGAKVRYLNWQVADLMLFLDLLDCGTTPQFLRDQFGGDGGFFAMGDTANMSQRSADAGAGWYLIVQFNALRYYQSADPDKRKPSFEDYVIKERSPKMLALGVDEGPGIVLNLAKRLSELQAVVSDIFPNSADQIRMHPTKSLQKEG